MTENQETPCQEDPESPKLEAVVLVVAPDDNLLNWMDGCWADFKLHLLKASTSEEASELASIGDPDLILVHGDACPEHGFDACEKIRQPANQGAIYLVLTNHDIQDHLHCLRMGCDGILPFPPDPSQIAQIITKTAARRKNEEPVVLWVDDDNNLMRVYAALLRKSGLRVVTSDQPMRVFELLPAHTPDILLLDFEMPNVNGAELCRMIRLRPEYRTLPVMILTASSDLEVRRKCLEAGADDFIRKPIDTPELLARIQAKVIRGDMLKSLATQDPLTLLNSHQAFLDVMTRECSRSRRYGASFVVGIIDVDQFKEINNRHSFTSGDEVLRRIAAVLRERFRRSDVLGRVGADRFAIILPEVDKATATAVLGEFLASIKGMIFNGITPGTTFTLSMRAGCAQFPADGDAPRSLMAAALHALQATKSAAAPRTPPRRAGERLR